MNIFNREIAAVSKSPFFDAEWYLEMYPEVRNSSMTPAEHYCKIGWREGKDPSSRFSTSAYLTKRPDVERAGMNPVYHYLKYGKREGIGGIIDNGDYRPYSKWRAFLRERGIKHNAELIKKHADTRILVILHLFYMSSWKEIKEYLMNLDVYKYDLIVTYTDVNIDEKVLADIRSYKPDADLQLHDNIGFDVVPFLEVLKNVDLSRYDVVFKLQSKGVRRRRIYIYGQYFRRRDWFLNLYEGCLGADTVHKTIDMLTDDSRKIGMVAAENLIVADPPHKRHMVEQYMRDNDIPIPDKYLFVSGTCFAERASLAGRLKDIPYSKEAAKKKKRDFSVAHRLERIICLDVLSAGYEIAGNNVFPVKRKLRSLLPDAMLCEHYSSARVYEDPRVQLDDEFVYFSLEMRRVAKYELTKIPLKDIRRSWKREPIPLEETMPYQYLVTRDPAIYEEYCRQNEEYYNLSIMSLERFEELIDSMEKNGFNEKDVIVVNQDNLLMDGQHRCCYMLYKYGGDYEIPALRVYAPLPIRLRSGVRRALKRNLSPTAYRRVYGNFRKLKRKLKRKR